MGGGRRQRIEVGEQDVSNALTTVQKDNLLLERNMGGEKKECAVVGGLGERKSNGGTQFYQQDRVYYGDIQPAQPAQIPNGSYNFLLEEETGKEADNNEKQEVCQSANAYRIRKLTPRETWRLMGFTDADFDKAAYRTEKFYLEGGFEKWCANLKVVPERQKLSDTETYVLCTTSDSQDMEILKTIRKSSASEQGSGRMLPVNFAIEKSEDMEHSECATDTIRCFTFMGMQCILTEEKDQNHTVITARAERGRENTEKCMKITTESNLSASRLYTILILTKQIMKLKIFGSTILRANISGLTKITENCESNIVLKILNLKMETISKNVSQNQLYKQAGNSIVRQVLMAIFSQMNIKGVRPWNETIGGKKEV